MANIKDVTTAVSSVGVPVLRAEWRKHIRGSDATVVRTFAVSTDLKFLPALRTDGKGVYTPIALSDVQVFVSSREDHYYPVTGLGYIVENTLKIGASGVKSNTVSVYLPVRLSPNNKIQCRDVTYQFDMETKQRLAAMCEAYTAALV